MDCGDADPTGVQAKIYGNFQFHADPDDPDHDLLYINHVSNGPSDIVVAHLDGKTGRFIPKSLTPVAHNFDGERVINGPEFVDPPGIGLGLVYRGDDGVHGVFRSPPFKPLSWNAFDRTVDGQPSTLDPPPLPSTYLGAYDYGNLPFGQTTYALYQPPCSAMCFADLRTGVPTDAAAVFKTEKLYPPGPESMVQGTASGDVLSYLCTKPAAVANKTCGLYSTTIDLKGGFTAAPILLTALPAYVGAMPHLVPINVRVHPASKANVVFVAASHESGSTIDIYQQANDTSPLTPIGSVPAQGDVHYRIVNDGQSTLLLHYIVRDGNLQGSYAVTVRWSKAHGYQIGGPTKIEQTADAEGRPDVEYLPARGRFAIFYRVSQRPSRMFRCFFDPSSGS